jgi:tetratricopeptide (TPR) repeat protein
MVHGYAGIEFTKADFAEKLIDRWLAWIMEFTQTYGINLELHVERAQKIDSEYANLVSAIRWCHQHQRTETLLDLVEGTAFYLYLVGLDSEFMEILEAAVQAAGTLQDERRVGRFLRQLARPLRVRGQYEKALEYLKKAKDIAFRHKDEAELGRTMEVYANILYNRGHLVETEQAAREILEIGERLNDLELKARAVQRLAESKAGQQQFDEALAWLDRSEQWCSELGWSRGLAWNALLRGTILIQHGNTTAAEPFLLQSQDMSTSWGERRLIAYNQFRLAEVYLENGKLKLASQMAEEARDLCERLGLVRKLAQVEELLRTLPGKETE